MDKATVESVMAKAMMLVGALDDSCEAATSLPFLEAVTTLRTEIESLAAQSAPAETSAVVSAPKFTRLKFFRDLSNDERMRMLRVFMDLSTIPDDAIKTHGVQRQLFDRVFAVAQSAQAPAQAVQEARCACNDRPASECPGEWEPGCDLGNNPKYVRAYVDADRASSGATPADVRMLTADEQNAIIDMHNTGRAQGDHECAEAIQRAAFRVNAGKRIPADGKIGGV